MIAGLKPIEDFELAYSYNANQALSVVTAKVITDHSREGIEAPYNEFMDAYVHDPEVHGLPEIVRTNPSGEERGYGWKVLTGVVGTELIHIRATEFPNTTKPDDMFVALADMFLRQSFELTPDTVAETNGGLLVQFRRPIDSSKTMFGTTDLTYRMFMRDELAWLVLGRSEAARPVVPIDVLRGKIEAIYSSSAEVATAPELQVA